MRNGMLVKLMNTCVKKKNEWIYIVWKEEKTFAGRKTEKKKYNLSASEGMKKHQEVISVAYFFSRKKSLKKSCMYSQNCVFLPTLFFARSSKAKAETVTMFCSNVSSFALTLNTTDCVCPEI